MSVIKTTLRRMPQYSQALKGRARILHQKQIGLTDGRCRFAAKRCLRRPSKVDISLAAEPHLMVSSGVYTVVQGAGGTMNAQAKKRTGLLSLGSLPVFLFGLSIAGVFPLLGCHSPVQASQQAQ